MKPPELRYGPPAGFDIDKTSLIYALHLKVLNNESGVCFKKMTR